MTSLFPKRSASWSILCLVGISAALAGWAAALLALTFVSIMPGLNGFAGSRPDVEVFSLAAALVSLLIGPFFWWLFLIRPQRFTLRRGILIGSGGSLVAHPLTWLLAMVVGSLSGINTLLGQPLRELVPAMKEPNLIGEVLLSLFLSIYSLILVGWITALVGGIVGGLLVKGLLVTFSE